MKNPLKRNKKEDKEWELRQGFGTYVMHGDVMWGDAITWQKSPSHETPNQGTIVGWCRPRPQAGDRLLVKMESGKWGWWIIESVDLSRDPHDMFFAEVVGAFGYVEGEEEPKTKRASEFVNKGEFV